MNPETLLRRIEAAAARQRAALQARDECAAKAKTWQERADAAGAEHNWLITNPGAPSGLEPIGTASPSTEALAEVARAEDEAMRAVETGSGLAGAIREYSRAIHAAYGPTETES